MKRSNLLSVATLAGLCCTHAGAAGGYFPGTCAIQPLSVYRDTSSFMYANGAGMSTLRLENFAGCTPLPPGPGMVVANGPCMASLALGVPGGPSGTFVAPCNYAARITRTGPNSFDTEMLQLDIVGGGLPPNVRIRENPALASNGQMTIYPAGGGYEIDSFFDIFTELSLDNGATWSPSVGGPTRIILSGPCYANCDQSVIAPVLNVVDFACFINKFAANDPYANCDGSSTAPVLNVADFACFLNKVAAGCN